MQQLGSAPPTRYTRCTLPSGPMLRHRLFVSASRLLSSSSGVATTRQIMPKLQVKVDITSDVICPWCWIGKKHLDTAMQHLADDFEFHIRWKPFLLNPFMPDQGIPVVDYFKMKFGEQAAARFLSGSSPVSIQGRSLGINFNSNRLVVATKKPHIILDFAAKHGKQHEMQEVLFRSYFSDGRNVSADDVLRELVSEVGLDPDKAIAALTDEEYVREFEEGVVESKQKGITGVPNFEFYLKDNPQVQQTFSGAQQVDTIVAVCSRLKSMAKM